MDVLLAVGLLKSAAGRNTLLRLELDCGRKFTVVQAFR